MGRRIRAHGQGSREEKRLPSLARGMLRKVFFLARFELGFRK